MTILRTLARRLEKSWKSPYRGGVKTAGKSADYVQGYKDACMDCSEELGWAVDSVIARDNDRAGLLNQGVKEGVDQ